MRELQFAADLIQDAKNAVADKNVALASQLIEAIQNEMLCASVKATSEKFHLCQRLRGILSLGEATGKISRDEAAMLHELRRLPATIDTALDSVEGTQAFARTNEVFRRISLHANGALQHYKLNQTHREF